MSATNDVKQYNLTQGRSLPEWLDERKRRKLLSVRAHSPTMFSQNLLHRNNDFYKDTLCPNAKAGPLGQK